jgi:acetyl-CoA carboxylase biotin carboxyl carrier protein
VRFADAVVDLDWRLPPVAIAPSADRPTASGLSAHVATANGHAASLESAAVGSTAQVSEQQPDLHYVRAPSVGTFYCAPKPGAAPFVAEGAVVSVGQQVGIVEAMKLMLPVHADQAGEVVQILATDGQAVEYDERLLALVPGN